MTLPPPVTEILKTLLASLQDSLGENLVGLYLRGSLALGDFIPETSDLDILAITETLVTETEFSRLLALRHHLDTLSNTYAQRLEIAYIDRKNLGRFEPGLRFPTLGQGEVLTWSEHRDNWILERWTVREHGLVLFGPQPRPLIDPISPAETTQAVRSHLQDWADWANDLDDADWLLPLSHKVYVVETMC